MSVQADEQAAVEASVVERQKQDALKDEIRVLENRYRAEVMSSVQATAERNAGHQPGSQASRNDPDSFAGRGFPRPPAGRAQSDRDPRTGSTTPLVSLVGPAMSPRSQTTSPNPQAKSPGSEAGFRTIHGRHRPDGSLGGYRSDRVVHRTHSENLYDSSIQNGREGDRTLSTQTSRSDGPSVVSSDDAQPGQGWRTPPKKDNNKVEKAQWG